MLEHEISAAWGEKDLEKSVELLRKVIRLQPRNPNARFLMGRVYGARHEYAEAVDWLEEAIEITPKNQQLAAFLTAGLIAKEFFDPTIAESFFTLATEQANDLPAKLALAGYLIQLRKYDVAKNLVNEVLFSHPLDPEANLLWSNLHEDQHYECIARLERSRNAKSQETRAKAAYQFAKILDKQGDYDGAMRFLVEAKHIFMPNRTIIVQNRERIRARHKELAVSFTRSKRDEWKESAPLLGPSRQLALLGGHPRSGTTLLEQVLDSHPEILSAEETQNFDIFALSPLMREHPPTAEVLDVIDGSSIDELIKCRENYFTAMDCCLGEPVGKKLLVDKNPSLTSVVPALLRIFPEIRFISMIRDPRDVVLSCYMQSFVPVSGVNGNYLTLEDTAAEYAGVMGIWTEVARHLNGIACEVRYEEMVEDLEGNARKVLDFLGIGWDECVMDFDHHARDKVVRSPTAFAVTEKIHTRAKNRWKNYEKHLEPVFKTLSPCLKALGYD